MDETDDEIVKFHANYIRSAELAKEQFDPCPVPELLQRIESGDFGSHYQIWPSVCERGDLIEVMPAMISILKSDLDYVIRSNCAEAVLKRLKFSLQIRACDLCGGVFRNEKICQVEERFRELLESKDHE